MSWCLNLLHEDPKDFTLYSRYDDNQFLAAYPNCNQTGCSHWYTSHNDTKGNYNMHCCCTSNECNEVVGSFSSHLFSAKPFFRQN